MTVPESQPVPQIINVPKVHERSTVRYIHQLRRLAVTNAPDYEIGYERPTTRLLATLAAIEPYDHDRLS
jgi:hypothetical protein